MSDSQSKYIQAVRNLMCTATQSDIWDIEAYVEELEERLERLDKEASDE